MERNGLFCCISTGWRQQTGIYLHFGLLFMGRIEFIYRSKHGLFMDRILFMNRSYL